MQVATNILEDADKSIARKARQLYREGYFTELVELLVKVERNKYLDSLLIRARSKIDNKNQIEEKTQIYPPTEDETMQNISKEEVKERIDGLNEIFQEKIQKKDPNIEKSISTEKIDIKVENPELIDIKKEKDNTKEIPKTTETLQKSIDEKNIPKEKPSLSVLKKSKQWLEEKKQDVIIKKTSVLLTETIQKKEEMKKVQKEKGPEHEEVKKLQTEIDKGEMNIAKNVQSNLLPIIESDRLSGMETFVKTLSCSELSGDVYDFVNPNNDETVFYLGDVTGHGTGAGLVMTMINTLTYSVVKRTNNLASILCTLNNEIKPKLSKNMFTTMIMFKWHHKLKKLTYAGAGHEYMLIYRSKTQKAEKIPSGGIAIGMLKDVSKVVKEKEIDFDYGDILLLYTDGVTEAWHQDKREMYSLEKLISDLEYEAKQSDVSKIGNQIFEKVKQFIGNKERTDDITIMVFRRVQAKNEDKIKNDYLKTVLRDDIIKNEAVMHSQKDKLNPDFQKNHDEFVEKSKQLAMLYLEEKKYFAAREEIRKSLQQSPNNESLHKLLSQIESKILESEGSGITRIFKHLFYSGLYKFTRKSVNPKAEYIKQMKKDLDKAFSNEDFDKAKEFLQKMKDIDPKNKIINKFENKIESIQEKKSSNILKKFFDLNVIEVKQDSRVDILDNKTLSALNKKGEMCLKISLDSKDKDEFHDEEFKPSREINKDYDVSNIFTKNDSLGLKKMLDGVKTSQTQIKSQIDSIPDLMSKNLLSTKESIIEWDKGGAMMIKRKKYSKFMATVSPMSTKDLFVFIEKLSAFVKVGIPIPKAISIIQDQAKNDGFIFILDEILTSLDSGKLLSQAMAPFPKQFPEMLIYLVYAGEKSGALPIILSDLAEQLKEQQLVKGKIKSAMVYPSVVVSAGLLIVGGMVIFIVPRLVKVYNETGVELPALTKAIIIFSSFMKANWLIVIFAIIFVIVGLFYFGKSKIGRKIYDFIYLYAPIMSRITRENNVMLFTSNLGILLENGIQIIEALNIVSKIVTNSYYKTEVLRIREEMITTGKPLSQSMGEKTNIFPLEALQSVSIGEQTGNLAKMMKSTGEMFKDKIKTTIKSLSEIIEPLLMIAIGLLVATILLSIMAPLFKLGKVLRKN